MSKDSNTLKSLMQNDFDDNIKNNVSESLSPELEVERLQVLMSSEKKAWHEKFESLLQEKDHLQQKLSEMETELENLRWELKQAKMKNQQELQSFIINKDKATKDIEILNSTINNLEKGIRVLLNSKRWKIGNTIGNIQNKVLFQKPQTMPADFLKKVLSKHVNRRKYN